VGREKAILFVDVDHQGKMGIGNLVEIGRICNVVSPYQTSTGAIVVYPGEELCQSRVGTVISGAGESVSRSAHPRVQLVFFHQVILIFDRSSFK
jgi:hypothetical protein